MQRHPWLLTLLAGCAALPAVSVSSAAPPVRLESLTSSLAPGDCRKSEGIALRGDPDAVREICPGIEGGYGLQVINEDGRRSVTVVTPDQKEHPLTFWRTITRHLSVLGERAEWRVKREGGKVVPLALMVRVDAYEDKGDPYKTTSYWAVAKITPGETCVTDRIPGSPKAEAAARQAADQAAGKPCHERLSR
jgi:hypothetical protein